jgi:hypothetical protein
MDVASPPPTRAGVVPLFQLPRGSRAPIVFGPDGKRVEEGCHFDAKTQTIYPVRMTLNADGTVARSDTMQIPAGAFNGVQRVTKMLKDAKGKEMGMTQAFLWQPHGPVWLRAYGPGGVRAEVISSRYEVVIYGADGRTVRRLRRVPAPVSLSQREKRSADSVIAEAASALPFGVPKSKAPIVGIVWSRDGSLWVERAVVDGAPREADVYDRNGTWIATAEWPREVRLMDGFPDIRGQVAHVLRLDADDLETVVRLRFR